MATFSVQPSDIVLFYDKRLPLDPEDSGVGEVRTVNRVAIVVDERGALSLGRRMFGRQRVELIPLQAIPTLQSLQMRRLTLGYAEEISQFFVQHANRPTHFEAGLRALRVENLQPLITGGFFPPQPLYKTDREYEAAWELLKSAIQPMDHVFTVDMGSRLSRFIAWSTDGAWSHVAAHVGNGELFESVTSGIRNGPIELYKGRRYRVAAYRHIDALKKPITAEEAQKAVRSHGFKPNAYNYRGALRSGWRAFRGDHRGGLTPNSQVLQGLLVFVAQA